MASPRTPLQRRIRLRHGKSRAIGRGIGAASALLGLLAASAPGAVASSGTAGLGPAVSGARAADGAYIAGVAQLGPRIVDLGIRSPAMGATMPVRVITPAGWSPHSGRTYPTVYLLQGASDNYTSWTRETDIEQLAATTDALVVTPDGGRAGFYTNWWNDGRAGGPQWETFHTEELPQLMSDAFGAGDRRAVIGLSEGGLGALDYAARHPGEYVFAGSFSGVVDLDDPGLRAGITLTCLREGVNPLLLWGDPKKNRDNWEAHNPAQLLNRFRGVQVYLSAATGMPGPLDVDSPPEAGLLEAPTYVPTQKFAQALRAAGVDVTVDLHLSGTHTWPNWQRELHLAWPSVLSALRGRS